MEEVKSTIAEEPKKKKAKSIPCAYGVKEPKNVNGLNKKYMLAFLEDNLKKGNITKEQIADFKKRKKDMVKESGVRTLFASMFMPHLIKAEELSFDDALDKLIKG